jgi:hypothetical protein
MSKWLTLIRIYTIGKREIKLVESKFMSKCGVKPEDPL